MVKDIDYKVASFMELNPDCPTIYIRLDNNDDHVSCIFAGTDDELILALSELITRMIEKQEIPVKANKKLIQKYYENYYRNN